MFHYCENEGVPHTLNDDVDGVDEYVDKNVLDDKFENMLERTMFMTL